jgi:DNA-binding NtrC family response regulator
MFVGGSQAILRVQELIDKAARSGSTVLIIGESGVGKDVSSNEITRPAISETIAGTTILLISK